MAVLTGIIVIGKMKRRLSATIIICLMMCGIFTGCRQSTATDNSDKTKEVTTATDNSDKTKEETATENKAEKVKENKKEEKSGKTKELDPAAAEDELKKMSDALSDFLWISMMIETEYNSLAPEKIDLSLSDEEKIRASVLAGKTDNVIDSTFVLGMGGFSEDKTAQTGPDGDGFHGMSVSKKDVDNNCIDLFGTKASWDDLPIGPVCDIYDAVRYETGNDPYALVVSRDIETETDLENHECTVEEENGKYIGKVNMFWGYWGELEQNPGRSNYVAEYTLEPDQNSKYKMIIKDISISPLESDEDFEDTVIEDGFAASGEGFFGLWVGSSKNKEDSLVLVQDLKDKGLDAYCIYTPEWENLNADRYWSVTVGMSADEERAEALIPDVESAGYKGAYIKYTGERLSQRVDIYMYTPDDVKITPSKVTFEKVSTEYLSGTEEDEGPRTLIVDSDTVFDKTCDMQFFPGYKKDQSVLEWFNSITAEDLMGVFEAGITGNHVDSFYGSYWWD